MQLSDFRDEVVRFQFSEIQMNIRAEDLSDFSFQKGRIQIDIRAE